jgi:predicted O-linked N-acetylglucosamine transferase (SPINDLY family)
MSSSAYLATAEDALRRGDAPSAVRAALNGLAVAPDSADATYLLGLAWHAGWLARTLALAPDHLGAAMALAAALAGTGRRGPASRLLRRALALAPALPPPLVNLGLVAGPPEAARPWLARALAAAPDDAVARMNFAATLDRLGLPALPEHRRTVALAPGLAQAALNQALAAAAAKQRIEAVRWHRRTLALDPLAADALAGLGAVARTDNRLVEGRSWDRRALALRPDHAPTLANIAHADLNAGEAPAALDWARRAEAADPSDPGLGRAAIGLMLFLTWPDPSAVLACHRRWAARHAVPAPRPRARTVQGRRLRIGYLSVSLRRHPVGYYLLPLLEHHDRSTFEIVLYAAGETTDDLTARLRAAADRWREVWRLDDAALAERIRSDAVDILVDLDGHAGGSRLTMFARRPAPAQVTWLDYPASTGTGCFDAVLADPYETPDGGERFYSEPVLRLPGGRVVYRPPAEAPDVGDPRNARLSLGCFNNPAKIGDDAIALWARVMAAIPQSTLTLKGRAYDEKEIRARYAARLAAHGIDAARLVFSGWSPHRDMLQELTGLDLVLDPLPFSGLLTSCEALWMGVPIVTLAGRRPVERQTSGLLHRVGLDELIAHDAGEYVAIAHGLAVDAGRRRAIRRDLRRRMLSSSLMDECGFAHAVEDAFRKLCQA